MRETIHNLFPIFWLWINLRERERARREERKKVRKGKKNGTKRKESEHNEKFGSTATIELHYSNRLCVYIPCRDLDAWYMHVVLWLFVVVCMDIFLDF